MVSGKKFYSKNLTLLCSILTGLQNQLYPAQIARQLGISKQLSWYYVRRLEEESIIKREFRDAMSSFSLTPKGIDFLKQIRGSKKSSLCVSRKNIRNHNLAFKLRIIQDNIQADFAKESYYREVLKKNWSAKVFVIPFPISMTIEKNPEYVIVNFHKFYTAPQTFLNDFFQKVWKGLTFVYDYFLKKYNIKLDIFEPNVIRFHLANERPDLDDKIKKNTQVTVKLNRKAKVIFPTDSEAWARIERSLGNGVVDIETNDLVYEEKLLQMPEYIYELRQIASVLPALKQSIDLEIKNKKLHHSVLNEMRDTLKAIREELSKK